MTSTSVNTRRRPRQPRVEERVDAPVVVLSRSFKSNQPRTAWTASERASRSSSAAESAQVSRRSSSMPSVDAQGEKRAQVVVERREILRHPRVFR